MVRYILEGEHLYNTIIDSRRNIGDYQSPWKERPLTNINNELEFCQIYRENFLNTIQSFTDDELVTIEIIRSEKEQRRKLGDYLNRVAYHESVHTGQMLSYLRMLNIDRPLIWD